MAGGYARRGNPPRMFCKMVWYLDPLTKETGALRLQPGSHRFGDAFAMGLEEAETWAEGAPYGVEQDELPAHACETAPGDVVVFHQSCKSVDSPTHPPSPTGLGRTALPPGPLPSFLPSFLLV